MVGAIGNPFAQMMQQGSENMLMSVYESCYVWKVAIKFCQISKEAQKSTLGKKFQGLGKNFQGVGKKFQGVGNEGKETEMTGKTQSYLNKKGIITSVQAYQGLQGPG